MKMISNTLICAAIGLASVGAFAQDAMKKSDAMSGDGMKSAPTMQDCKDHMAMAKPDAMKKDEMKKDEMKKDEMKKDDAAMKMDKACSDMMMKGDAMKKDDAMKK
jgi:pentapeptide MXKDX repeat protein